MHGIELVPNLTIFIQIAIFFACYFVLRKLVFDPFLDLLEIRHQKTEGLKEKAAQSRVAAEEARTNYENFMQEERKKVAAWVEDERRKIGEEERKILQEARDRATGEIEVARGQIREQTQQAREQLLPKVSELASHITSKLLGKNVTVRGNPTQVKSNRALEDAI